MKIEIIRLLYKKHERNLEWRSRFTKEIEYDLEWQIELRLEFFDFINVKCENESELSKALTSITEISTIIASAIELMADKNEYAANRYIEAISNTKEDIIQLTNICMEMYCALSVEKCKEYADIILAGESMFTTK